MKRSCLHARMVTFRMLPKKGPRRIRIERSLFPEGWGRSAVLAYVREVHPTWTVRITDWPYPEYWMANPAGFEDYRWGL